MLAINKQTEIHKQISMFLHCMIIIYYSQDFHTFLMNLLLIVLAAASKFFARRL